MRRLKAGEVDIEHKVGPERKVDSEFAASDFLSSVLGCQLTSGMLQNAKDIAHT